MCIRDSSKTAQAPLNLNFWNSRWRECSFWENLPVKNWSRVSVCWGSPGSKYRSCSEYGECKGKWSGFCRHWIPEVSRRSVRCPKNQIFLRIFRVPPRVPRPGRNKKQVRSLKKFHRRFCTIATKRFLIKSDACLYRITTVITGKILHKNKLLVSYRVQRLIMSGL